MKLSTGKKSPSKSGPAPSPSGPLRANECHSISTSGPAQTLVVQRTKHPSVPLSTTFCIPACHTKRNVVVHWETEGRNEYRDLNREKVALRHSASKLSTGGNHD